MAVCAGKLELLPPPIGPGFGSDIDDDIPDGASNTPYDLHFAVRLSLIVHSSQSAFVSRKRNAMLTIIRLETVRGEFVNTESSGEVTAPVAYRFQVYAPGAVECRWIKSHRAT